MTVRILQGDCRDVLKTLPDESVHCVVTSPPYFGLRDYGVAGQIGLEHSIGEHMEALVEVFREVRRVLRSDGTAWVNYGDAYAGSWGAQGRGDKRLEMEVGGRIEGDGRKSLSESQIVAAPKRRQTGSLSRTGGLKPKDLMGLPWRLAFALQEDGWYLRQDIIWHKPNPMPESIRDRCTKAHEYLFLLAKAERYHYDFDAMQEPASETTHARRAVVPANWATGEGPHTPVAHNTAETHRKVRDVGIGQNARPRKGAPNGSGTKNNKSFDDAMADMPGMRNKRSVWSVPSEAFSEAHFATFPTALIAPCILAGCPAGGTVLDPFGGAGTTGLVADRHHRDAILIELNPQYAAMARKRIEGESPLFAEVA